MAREITHQTPEKNKFTTGEFDSDIATSQSENTTTVTVYTIGWPWVFGGSVASTTTSVAPHTDSQPALVLVTQTPTLETSSSRPLRLTGFPPMWLNTSKKGSHTDHQLVTPSSQWNGQTPSYTTPQMDIAQVSGKAIASNAAKSSAVTSDGELEIAGCALSIVGSVMQLTAVMLFLYSDGWC